MPGGLYEINDRGLQQALERRLLIRDDVGFTLSPEIVAMLPIAAQELLFHLGWRRYSLFLFAAAVAANAAIFRIRNPLNSGTIVQVDAMILGNTVALEIGSSEGAGSTDLSTVVAGGIPRDTRQSTGGTLNIGSTAICSRDALAAQVQTASDIFTPANVSANAIVQAPVFLTPGFFLNAFVQTLNQSVACTVIWQERFMNDQENTV